MGVEDNTCDRCGEYADGLMHSSTFIKGYFCSVRCQFNAEEAFSKQALEDFTKELKTADDKDFCVVAQHIVKDILDPDEDRRDLTMQMLEAIRRENEERMNLRSREALEEICRKAGDNHE